MDMKWLIILYPIFWFLVFSRIKQKKNHRYYCAVILVFLLSALASSYLIFYDPEYQYKQLSIVAIIYHLLMMWLLLSPVGAFDRLYYSKINPIPINVLYPFTITIIIIMVLFIVNGIQDVSLAAIATDSQELRQLLREEKEYSNVFMRYMDYFGSTYSVIPLALMFYYMVFSPKSKIIIYLLLICSLGQAVLSLQAAGREYMIKYIFVFLSLYYLTSNNLSKSWKKRTLFFFISIAVVFGAIFLLITFMRFTYTKDISASNNILNYLGQGNANFSEFFIKFPDGIYPEKGQNTFPLIFGHSDIGSYDLNDYIYSDIELNVFGTGIGSWLNDCGIWLTIIVTLIFSFLFSIIGSIKEYNVFSLIYFGLVFEQVFSLLFFFHGSWNGTRVLSILILIFLDYLSRNSMRNRNKVQIVN